jgi:large subunit ribosomal protein L13e
MVRHNNVVPNQHFKKKWHAVIGVKTWFNQPARKLRRRNGEWRAAWGPAAPS